MKKREILQQIVDLRRDAKDWAAKDRDRVAMVEARVERLKDVYVDTMEKAKQIDATMARTDLLKIDDVANKLAWLHERVDMLATRLENMRGNVTLDDGAAKRLAFAVGQFAARLDRLEALKPPRKRPRVTSDKPPATPNGTTETAK